MGSVRNPGYVYAPADYVLRDLLTRAGGPNPDAEVAETIVRRAGQTIWDVKQVRDAFANGLSLDRMHLRAGDEVYVPQHQNRFQLSTILSITSAAAAVSVAAIQLGRH
jgi:protein involved in polysaccharide export with SLBB domain